MKVVFESNDKELLESHIDELGMARIVDKDHLRDIIRRERQEARSKRLLMLATGMLITVLILMIGGAV